MAESDWRAKFTAESRQRIVGKTMERLKKSLPFTLDASINHVAEQLESEAFNAAATEADYMRKLCMSLNSVEENAQQASKSEISVVAGVNQNLRHQAGSRDIQSLADNRQGQPVVIPNWQFPLPQNMQSNSFSSFPPAFPSTTGSHQPHLSSFARAHDMQNMKEMPKNCVNNSMHQETLAHIYYQGKKRQLITQFLNLAAQMQKEQVPPHILLLYEQFIYLLQSTACVAQQLPWLQPEANSSPQEHPSRPQTSGGLRQPPNSIGHMPFIQQKMWDPVVSSKGGPWLPAPPISLFVEEPPITQTSTNIDEEQVRRKMLLAEFKKALAADENYLNVLKPLVAEVEKENKWWREVITNAEMEINKIEESKRAKS